MGTVKKERKYQKGVFFSLKVGKVRREVTKGTPEAEGREVPGDKPGEKKIKYEIVDDGIKGFVTGVNVNTDGDYVNLEVAMQDETASFTLVCSWGTGYAKRIIQRLPNVDFTKEVYIEPYDFIGDNDNRVVGANVFQDDQKINSFYHEIGADGRFTGLLYGYPPYDEELIGEDKDEKILYRAAVSKFLKAVIAERIVPALHEANLKRVPPSVQTETAQQPAMGGTAEPINSPELLPEADSDLPF
jgi:hypothetical protein